MLIDGEQNRSRLIKSVLQNQFIWPQGVLQLRQRDGLRVRAERDWVGVSYNDSALLRFPDFRKYVASPGTVGFMEQQSLEAIHTSCRIFRQIESQSVPLRIRAKRFGNTASVAVFQSVECPLRTVSHQSQMRLPQIDGAHRGQEEIFLVERRDVVEHAID